MRILILIPLNTLGGAEQILKMIALNQEENTVQIFVLKDSGSKLWKDLPDTIDITFLSKKSKFLGLLNLLRYFLFKQRKRFDYLFTSHIFMTAVLGIFIRLGIVRKKYFVARESTSIMTRFSGLKLSIYKMAYELGYGHIDLLICQTDYMKKQLLEQYPRFTEKTKVIPNPIDLQLIRNRELETPKISKDQYIVTAGRLIPEKGYDLLINAYQKINLNYPHYKLLILGEGGERPHLENLIKQGNLEEQVELPGRVDNVYPYFKMAKLCVVSSRIEGFPNVLLQMMSQNEKVVSTLCAGGIEQLKGVFTCPPGNVELLAESMINCLESDTKENRQLFKEELNKRTIDAFLDQIQSYLDDTLQLQS